MSRFTGFLRQLSYPTITSRSELAGYVVRTTLVCAACAVAVDVVNQLAFFVDWPTSWRSWTITAFLASSIALGATWVIGRVHLELYHAKVAVDELSRTDPLTGLPNRRAVFEVAESTAPTAMVLVIVDIDRFKRVNDTKGHLAGDEVIRMIGRMMAIELGSLGYVGRIGGEEFALVGTKVDFGRLIASLESFRRRIAGTPIVVAAGAVIVTISAGVAIREPSQTFNDLYAEADRALYVAKTQGRNRISYSPAFAALAIAGGQDEAMWLADPESHPQIAPPADEDVASVA